MFVFYANIKEMIFILGVILPSLHSKGVKKKLNKILATIFLSFKYSSFIWPTTQKSSSLCLHSFQTTSTEYNLSWCSLAFSACHHSCQYYFPNNNTQKNVIVVTLIRYPMNKDQPIRTGSCKIAMWQPSLMLMRNLLAVWLSVGLVFSIVT